MSIYSYLNEDSYPTSGYSVIGPKAGSSEIKAGNKGESDGYFFDYKNPAQNVLNFGLGEGHDVIDMFSARKNTGSRNDVIRFGEGISADMINFVRKENDLVIYVGDGKDSLTIYDYFAGKKYQAFTRFEFADGTVWQDFRTTEKWKEAAATSVYYGSDANDKLTGSGIFVGGKGNDTIISKYSSDYENKLVFNLGDGKDTVYYDSIKEKAALKGSIVFGDDVTADMISFATNNNGKDLIVKVGNSGDSITLKDFFRDMLHANQSQAYTRFEFADGSVWNDIRLTDAWGKLNLSSSVPSFNGTDKRDVFCDAAGNITGGKGNDAIYFNAGAAIKSTMNFNLGDGQDIVYLVAGLSKEQLESLVVHKDNVIKFGRDVTPDMISFKGDENSLTIVVGNKGDQINLRGYFTYGEVSQLFSRMEFADGTVWENFQDTQQWAKDILGITKQSAAAPVLFDSNALVNQNNSLISAMACFASDASGICAQSVANIQQPNITLAASA